MEITRETTLSEIFKNPERKKILAKYNLPCLSCPYAKSEMETLKIGEICRMYSVKTQNLLKELNQLYKK